MKSVFGLMLTAFAALLLSACNGDDDNDIVCTTEARAGIVITVYDEESGNSLCEVNGTAHDTNSDFEKDLQNFEELNCSSSHLSGVYEREGTYQVIVFKEDYEDWVSSDIIVTGDECHVETQTLDVYLEQEETNP